MTWEVHITQLAKTVSQRLYVMRRLQHIVSTSTIKTAYFGYIHSKICYAILVWGHSCHLYKLFAIQRKCVRIMSKLNYRDDCRNAYKRLGIMTVPSIYIFSCLLYAKRNSDQFRGLDHVYDTRHKSLLQPEFLRLSRTRNGVRFFCHQLFNSLPLTLKDKSYASFRFCVKTLLIENVFYSLEEFVKFNFR